MEIKKPLVLYDGRPAQLQDGDTITGIPHLDESKWTYSLENFEKTGYGALYTHTAITESLGIGFIDGFTVPTNDDWNALIDFVGGSSIAGKKLKSPRLESTHIAPHWFDWEDIIGEDEFNFSAHAVGYIIDGMFDSLGYYGLWWSLTEHDINPDNAWSIGIDYSHDEIDNNPFPKHWGFAIRCIRDLTLEEELLGNGTFLSNVKDFEGNLYQVVKINNKAWLAQNLRTAFYIDGTPISQGNFYVMYNDISTPGIVYADEFIEEKLLIPKEDKNYSLKNSKEIKNAGDENNFLNELGEFKNLIVVKSDWEQEDENNMAFIENKPTIDNSKWEFDFFDVNLRLPTAQEFQDELDTWTDIFDNTLKLPGGGQRWAITGALQHRTNPPFSRRHMWTLDTVDELSVRLTIVDNLVFESFEESVSFHNSARAMGNSVRLILDDENISNELFENHYQNKIVFKDGLEYGFCYNPITQRVWLDRNLGAQKVAEYMDDVLALGDLYQWGRPADGHEKVDSPIYDSETLGFATNSDALSSNPWHGKFITRNTSPNNWLNTNDTTLWHNLDGKNVPKIKAKKIRPKNDLYSLKDSHEIISAGDSLKFLNERGDFENIDHNELVNTHNLTTDIDHNELTNYDINEHRTINDSGTETADLWSADKINSELNNKVNSSDLDDYVPYTDAVDDVDLNDKDLTNVKILEINDSAQIPIIKPETDTTNAIQITKADGTTAILTFDTENGKTIQNALSFGSPLVEYRDQNGNINIEIRCNNNSSNDAEINIGFGTKSLQSMHPIAKSNLAIGALSQSGLTNGNENISLGNGSLSSVGSGNKNVAIGMGSRAFGGSNESTAIGYFSLFAQGNNNVAIGSNSGSLYWNPNLQTLLAANKSIFIGSNCYAKNNNSTNEIVIGTESKGNGSNTVTLGNDEILKTFLKGQVDIVKLNTTINGFIKTINDDGTIEIDDTEYVSDISNLVPYTGATDDVDLNDKDLTTVGNISANNFFGNGENLSGILLLEEDQTINGTKTFNENIILTTGTTANEGIRYISKMFLSAGTNVPQIIKIALYDSGNRIVRGRISGSRNVGSSTTNTYIIDIAYGPRGDTTNGILSFTVLSSWGGTGNGIRPVLFEEDGQQYVGISISVGTSHQYPSRWYFDGYLSPIVDLESVAIDSVTNIEDLNISNNAGSLLYAQNVRALNNVLVDRILTVGEGTFLNPNENSAIHIPFRGSPGTERVYMELQGVFANNVNNENGGAFIKFRTSTAANFGPEIGAVRRANGDGDLLIKTGGNNVTERVRILDNGNVGINTTNPTEKLDVNGNIKTEGDIELTDSTKGIILKSPNGTRFRVRVLDDGSLTTEEI